MPCVLLSVSREASRDAASGQIVFGGRGPILFSSDQLIAKAGGRPEAASLFTDAIWFFVDESPLPLAGRVLARLQAQWSRNRDIRVIPMSDTAARSLTGISGPLLHADSVRLADNELLVVLLNGDECEPCSFHGKYRRGTDKWHRLHAMSFTPNLLT